jgi:hypothetical protein
MDLMEADDLTAKRALSEYVFALDIMQQSRIKYLRLQYLFTGGIIEYIEYTCTIQK